MAIALTDAAEIINELGDDRFPWRIRKWLSRHAALPAIYHSVAMCYDRSPACVQHPRQIHHVSSLFSASDIAPDVVSQALDLYTHHGEWRQDALISRLEHPLEGTVHIEQIAPPMTQRSALTAYQQLCDYSQLGTEYALTLTEAHHIYTYSLYQKRGAPPFSTQNLRGLSVYGPFILTLLRKHAQFALCAQPTSSTPQRVFRARLSDCGVRLSLREYETCLGVLNGENMAQLACRMRVKETSVRTYLDRALIKLHLSGKNALYRWCLAEWQESE